MIAIIPCSHIFQTIRSSIKSRLVFQEFQSRAVVSHHLPNSVADLSVPFNRSYRAGNERKYLEQALANAHLGGGGPFFGQCREWMESELGVTMPLFTHSCTHALEFAAVLSDVGPGDEVIMPSFTFTSTANAFVLRGATPVFVDIRPDTLNLDERLLEDAITPATKVIVPVHYAGVSCEMDTINAIADRHGISVIEDAAHAFLSTYKGKPLGTLGRFGVYSFHESKGIHCGEGGVLLSKDPSEHELIDIVSDKGTNRRAFVNGLVDKYSWVHMGSSYLPAEPTMAYLFGQFQTAVNVTRERVRHWEMYQDAFTDLESRGVVQRPYVPAEAGHNAHLYYLLLRDSEARDAAIRKLREMRISTCFHYVPLHSAEAGKRYGRAHGDLARTTDLSARLIRLPLWLGMADQTVERVISCTRTVLASV